MIIHISGPSGSGKTTLGLLLKKELGNKVIVKDLDNLFQEFRKEKKYKYGNKFEKSEYQEYINSYIKKQNSSKVLILVGINSGMYFYKDHYYETNANYKFYIDLPVNDVLKQKFNRNINELFGIFEYKDKIFDGLIKDEKSEIKNVFSWIKPQLELSKMRKDTEKWNNDHKRMKYIFMNHKQIYEEVKKLVNSKK